MIKSSNKDVFCSFCSKSKDEVKTIISSGSFLGMSVYICEECVSYCDEIVKKMNIENTSKNLSIYPLHIKKILDDEVIGQEKAKEIISVAVFMHMIRTRTGVGSKSNLLMIGPSGSGKTLMIQTLASAMGIPFAISDATALTESGYVGEDVENVIIRLLQICEYDVQKAEKGIIYIDEIDKIARKSSDQDRFSHRDVSGEGVQHGLLKILEGSNLSINHKSSRGSSDVIQINTKNILFICGGSFDGIQNIVKKRLNNRMIGIGNQLKLLDYKDDSKLVTTHDLVKFGMIPEFVGRLPVIVMFDSLTEDDLTKIITQPKSSILKQYKEMLMSIGVDLNIEPEAIRAIAREAHRRKVGARGIRTLMEELLFKAIYKVDGKKYSINIREEDVLSKNVKLCSKK